MPRILVFGASITYGAWDEEGGWTQRLRKFLDKKALENPDLYFRVFNLGIPGNTTEDLLKRFEFESIQRLRKDEDAVFIFGTGTNDSQFLTSKNALRILPEKFKENIQKLIDIAKKFSSKIVFLESTPVDEKETVPIPWNKDRSCKNENIQRYNEIIKSICKGNRIYFIGTFDEWKRLDYEKLLEDGLHPNSEGHKKIFETVKNFLTQNKII